MSRRPHVTDHALLRYLQRVVGVDVELHRRQIERRVALAVEVGACGLVSDGFRYALSENRVTTVMSAASDPLVPPLRPVSEDE